MAATFKGTGEVQQTLSDIRSKNLPHHYQKPLIAIEDDADRNAAIDKIIQKVFGSESFNADINTKKDLQDALEKAVIEVSKEPGSKFKRPVTGVSANYLGRWIGTNISVQYDSNLDIAKNGASKQRAKQVLQATLEPKPEDAPASAVEPEVAALEPTETPTNGPAPETKKGQDLDLSGDYRMSEYAYDGLLDMITTRNKRGARYGIPTIGIKIIKEEFKPRQEKDPIGGGYSDTNELVKIVTIKLEVPTLNLPGGWKFIARIDHEEFGNLIMSVPDSGFEGNLREMFGKSQPSTCDHCHEVRRRTSTFVLLNDKGELKRVGKQCLRDYLPGGEQAVSKVLGYADFLTKLALGIAEAERSEGGGEGGDDREGGGVEVARHTTRSAILLGQHRVLSRPLVMCPKLKPSKHMSKTKQSWTQPPPLLQVGSTAVSCASLKRPRREANA